jgi:MoxR-like ATPase
VKLEELERLFAAVEEVYVDSLLKRWIVDLVRATRELEIVQVGASVRGTLALERVARAWALLHGRSFVAPEDVEKLFVPVLGHRFVLEPELMLDQDLTQQEAIGQVFAAAKEHAPRPRPEWGTEAPAGEA